MPKASKLPGLKKSEVRRACGALLKYVEDNKTESVLLNDDEIILLTIALVHIPQGRRKDKPIRLDIPKPLHDLEGAEVCLFAKDYKGEGHKEAKQQWHFQQKAGIKKVVGLSKLKTKYEAPEAKRQLASSFDIFLADERILPSLPKLIGKSFFKRKRQPIPIDCTKKDWINQVKLATKSTYMFHPQGNTVTIKHTIMSKKYNRTPNDEESVKLKLGRKSCVSFHTKLPAFLEACGDLEVKMLIVRIGKSSFTAEECAENAVQALKQATEHIPKNWAGVRAVFLKTPDSKALPVYQKLPNNLEE